MLPVFSGPEAIAISAVRWPHGEMGFGSGGLAVKWAFKVFVCNGMGYGSEKNNVSGPGT